MGQDLILWKNLGRDSCKAHVTNKINLYLRKTFFSKFLLYLDLEVVKAALAVSCCLGTLYTEVFDCVENPGLCGPSVGLEIVKAALAKWCCRGTLYTNWFCFVRTLDLCGSSVSLEPVKAVLSKCPLLSSINLSSCRALPRGMKRLYHGLPLVQLRSSMLNPQTDH